MNKRLKINLRQRTIHTDTNLSSADDKPTLGSVRDLIGLVTAAAGIFTALLYLSGRNFATGYFAAMNIPSYHVSFSLWEYGEVAWRPMIVYPAILSAITSLIWIVLFSVTYWILLPFIRLVAKYMSKWTNKSQGLIRTKPKFPKQLREPLTTFLLAASTILLLVSVDFTLQFIRDWGELTGHLSILQNSSQIDIISTTPLALENGTESNSGIYQYNNYQLVTLNDDRYYVFKELDSTTCRPSQIYVIDAANLIQVNIRQPISLADRCVKSFPVEFIPTLMFLFSK